MQKFALLTISLFVCLTNVHAQDSQSANDDLPFNNTLTEANNDEPIQSPNNEEGLDDSSISGQKYAYNDDQNATPPDVSSDSDQGDENGAYYE